MSVDVAWVFMDGLDGLAGGVAVIAASFMCAIAWSQGSYFVYLASYALIASVAGFLLFNFPPARIFMGDVGSAYVGYVFATLAIIGASFDYGTSLIFEYGLSNRMRAARWWDE